MSTGDDGESYPRSMRHKQILQVAESNPDASIDELASKVPSATTDLVERILEKHGDPAVEDEDPTEQTDAPEDDESVTQENGDAEADEKSVGNSADSGNSEAEDSEAEEPEEPAESEFAEPEENEAEPTEYPSLDDLTEKQRELVARIASEPEATQQAIATHFDVTPATVSRWANEIEGLDWDERKAFVESVVEDVSSADSLESDSTDEIPDEPATRSESDEAPSNDESAGDTEPRSGIESDIEPDIERLEERVSKLETGTEVTPTSADPVFEDPELVHKIVHACMKSDRITESEELRILETLCD